MILGLIKDQKYVNKIEFSLKVNFWFKINCLIIYLKLTLKNSRDNIELLVGQK